MNTAAESQVYRDLMRFKPEGLSPNAWAVKSGVSRTVWADMRRHGNPSRRTLEKLLAVAGSSLAEFEALRVGVEPRSEAANATGTFGETRGRWGPAPSAPLPLVFSGLAGEWGQADQAIELIEILHGQIIDRLPRPLSLAADRHAYAITVVGNGMWPRFAPGRRIAVSTVAPVAIGDDVLVVVRRTEGEGIAGSEWALIAQLVKRSARSIELRQFNPALTVSVDAEDVRAIHRIPGELI